MQANYLHAGHDHSWAEHLLEPLEPMLPGGEKTVGFLGHLLADAGQIYLMLLVVMFAVFLLQTYIDTDRMQRKLASLKNIWGYLLAFGLGVISPFCSCSIVPVLMGLIAVGVPMSVCLCMLTTASLLNLTAVTALYSLEGVGFASVYLVCSLVIVALSSFLLSRCDLRDAARDYHLAEHHHHHDHCCDCGHEHHHDHPLSMAERCRSALCDTLSILKTTWFWILLSVAAAAALESYLPLEQITQVVADHSMLSGLLAAVIGFPLHWMFQHHAHHPAAARDVCSGCFDLHPVGDGDLGAQRGAADPGAQAKGNRPLCGDSGPFDPVLFAGSAGDSVKRGFLWL